MKRLGLAGVATLVVAMLVTLSAAATTAEMYFASDKNGQNRVTNVQEGTEIWIVVYDPDENIDCDVRDKIWTDVKVMDPKTGAYIVWVSYEDETGDPAGQPYNDSDYVPYKGHYPGNSAGWLGADYLEETGADTGLFVSSAARSRSGRAKTTTSRWQNTHVVDDSIRLSGNRRLALRLPWGHYEYVDDRISTFLRPRTCRPTSEVGSARGRAALQQTGRSTRRASWAGTADRRISRRLLPRRLPAICSAGSRTWTR